MTAESTHYKIFISFHYWTAMITCIHCLHSQEGECHLALQHIQLRSRVLDARGVRLLCVWCLVTKRSMSRVREVRGRVVLWRGGREREGLKRQEAAALVSLPGESYVKDIGVTLSTQAQSWGISLASLTRRHSSVLPEWTTLTPIWQEVEYGFVYYSSPSSILYVAVQLQRWM